MFARRIRALASALVTAAGCTAPGVTAPSTEPVAIRLMPASSRWPIPVNDFTSVRIWMVQADGAYIPLKPSDGATLTASNTASVNLPTPVAAAEGFGVQARAAGTARLTATWRGFSDSFDVAVGPPITFPTITRSFIIAEPRWSLPATAPYRLYDAPTGSTTGGVVTNVVTTSSDPSIASVSSIGELTEHQVGTVIFTTTYNGNTFQFLHSVHPRTYTGFFF